LCVCVCVCVCIPSLTVKVVVSGACVPVLRVLVVVQLGSVWAREGA
jgi:hypothetical protein